MESKNETKESHGNCEKLKHDIQQYGTPLTPDTAKGYIKHYLDGVQAKPHDDHNFGYLFGFDNITDFISRINDYNDNLGDDDLPVQGIRVYIGRHVAIDPNKPTMPREKIMDTIFLIPVKSNGIDLPDLTQLEGNTLILGEPRPCPNECLMSLSFLRNEKK